MAIVYLSICLSCAWPKSIMKGHRKLKIGRKVAHVTGDTGPHLEIERSWYPGRLMLRRKMHHVCWRGRLTNFTLDTGVECERPASLTCVVTSQVKCQDNNVMSSVWCMFAYNSTKRSCRNTKIGRKVVLATADIPNQLGQRSMSPGHLTPWPKIKHIVRTGRPTNFTLGIWMEYLHHRHMPWPQRSRL